MLRKPGRDRRDDGLLGGPVRFGDGIERLRQLVVDPAAGAKARQGLGIAASASVLRKSASGLPVIDPSPETPRSGHRLDHTAQ